MGHFDPDVYKSLSAGGDSGEIRAKIEAMAGPSGFMVFRTSDHGALLRLAGQKRKALQYLVGNPPFALQMTQHDIRASLYAPLRVLLCGAYLFVGTLDSYDATSRKRQGQVFRQVTAHRTGGTDDG
jgi:hypothetical protein